MLMSFAVHTLSFRVRVIEVTGMCGGTERLPLRTNCTVRSVHQCRCSRQNSSADTGTGMSVLQGT